MGHPNARPPERNAAKAFYVNPHGHLVELATPPLATTTDADGKPRLKDGWRAASTEDVEAARRHAASDARVAGAGGPLKKR